MNPIQRVKSAIQWRMRSRHLTSFAEKLERQVLKDPYVVIAMPGSLHVAALAVQKVPHDVDRLMVLNGLAPWEAELAQSIFEDTPIVDCRARMDHDQVLDILFDHLPLDFGILDYDCFVLEPRYFYEMQQLAPDALMNACFSRRHPISGLRVPETFFLFFSRSRVQQIERQFGVTCRPVKWAELNAQAQQALRTLGIDREFLPEAHKDYFDTLRAIMMLGGASGLNCDFKGDFPASPTPDGELFHVGGISTPNRVDGIWRFRGAYFWRKALETCQLPELRHRYEGIYGAKSADELKAQYPQWSKEIPGEFYDFCDEIIARSTTDLHGKTLH